MKKIKWLLATVCIAVLLAGCSNVTDSNPEITIPEGTLLTEKPANYKAEKETDKAKILGTWVAISKVTPPLDDINAACNTRYTMIVSDDSVTSKQEIDLKPVVTAYAKENNKTEAESWVDLKKIATENFGEDLELYDNGYIFVLTFESDRLPSVYLHETDKNSFVVNYGENDWAIYTRQ